jgi:pimeloyl-ACP methyl ester carboxylesterase
MQTKRIFLHGLEGSSRGFKATYLRQLFPDMLTPDFAGSLEERMAQLVPLLDTKNLWVIVGSSFGGLMGALYACANPRQVQQLILLAPALTRPQFALHPPLPISTPTVIYHGEHDVVVPIEPVQALAEQTFINLTFHTVDDDHSLRSTVQAIDWVALLGQF